MSDNTENRDKYLAEDEYFDDIENDDSRRNNDNDNIKEDDGDDVDAILSSKHQELNKMKENTEPYYGKSSSGNTNTNRQNRLYTPYNSNSTQKYNNSGNNNNNNPANFNADRMLFKILLNKSQAGSVIGSGGSSIKELSEITNTNSIVSPMNNLYPGTSDRISIFNGKYENVVSAVSLMIKAIGHNNSEHKHKNWDLKSHLVTDGSYDNIQIELKAVIPAAAAGIVIGQGGSNLKLLSSTYSVEVSVENKDVASFTKERLVVLKGTVANIDAALKDIMQKIFVDQNFKFYYSITNSNYPQIPQSNMMQQQPQQQQHNRYYQQNTQHNAQGYPGNPYNPGYPMGPNNPRDASIMTANLPIPDMLVGSLVGVQGAVINEIKRSSGANISVSKKGEYIPGSTNRNLTITGTPMSIQMAHSLIINKLKMLGYEC